MKQSERIMRSRFFQKQEALSTQQSTPAPEPTMPDPDAPDFPPPNETMRQMRQDYVAARAARPPADPPLGDVELDALEHALRDAWLYDQHGETSNLGEDAAAAIAGLRAALVRSVPVAGTVAPEACARVVAHYAEAGLGPSEATLRQWAYGEGELDADAARVAQAMARALLYDLAGPMVPSPGTPEAS